MWPSAVLWWGSAVNKINLFENICVNMNWALALVMSAPIRMYLWIFMADKKQDSGQWEWAIHHARQRRGSVQIFYDNYKVTLGQEITWKRFIFSEKIKPAAWIKDFIFPYPQHPERASLVIITYYAITFNICVGLEGLGPIKIGPVQYSTEFTSASCPQPSTNIVEGTFN